MSEGGLTGPVPEVLVVVGTDRHPFDRLMTWLADWYSQRPARPQLLVQYGTSRRPDLPSAVPYLSHADLRAAMASAALVVTHGGPASITEARRAGRLPIVVPRDPAHGEHVDDHQLLFTRRLAHAGMIECCGDESALVTALTAGVVHPDRYRLANDPTDRAARQAAVARVGEIVEELLRRPSDRTPIRGDR